MKVNVTRTENYTRDISFSKWTKINEHSFSDKRPISTQPSGADSSDPGLSIAWSASLSHPIINDGRGFEKWD
jgi:hypothetical protein